MSNKTTNLEKSLEVIGQAIHDFMGLTSEKPEDKNVIDSINNLLQCAQEGYVLVQWPESQDLMEEEWFEKEAILSSSGDSAYFVPIKRVIN